jgi:peptidyl-prolyl cis-trans isomerase SurA
VVDGVAAIVGDDVILLSEVDAAASAILGSVEAKEGALPVELRSQVRAQALRNLIDEKLIAEAGDRLGLKASDADVDRAAEMIARGEGLTVEQVYEAAALQGLSRESYRAELAAEITRVRVISTAVQSRVTVTDAEIEELFQRRYRSGKAGAHTRVRHVLLPWPEGATQADRDRIHALAIELRESALAGRDFASIARQHSRAPSAAEGGLTLFRQGEVAPELEPYVFGMQPGEISPPIHTSHGVNLIQVVERFDPSSVQLQDVRGALHAELFDRKTQAELRPWLEELRENRYIEVVAPELK